MRLLSKEDVEYSSGYKWAQACIADGEDTIRILTVVTGVSPFNDGAREAVEDYWRDGGLSVPEADTWWQTFWANALEDDAAHWGWTVAAVLIMVVILYAAFLGWVLL